MRNALEIRGLRKQYGKFCLRGVDLTIPEGTVMGLVGENGAGKTTLLRLALGLAQPDAGTVRVFGTPVLRLSKEDFCKIGVVFDGNCIPSSLDVRQANGLFSELYGTWQGETFLETARRFGLPEDRKIASFSKGMQTKLAIAAALSHGARLLVLDEPTAGLDPVMREEILDLLFQFIGDGSHSVLFSSHITTDLDKICDYVTYLSGGRVLFSEEKDVLKSRYVLVHADETSIGTLPSSAVLGVRRRQFGTDALVRADSVPAGWETEPVCLEDIVLFTARRNREGEEILS